MKKKPNFPPQHQFQNIIQQKLQHALALHRRGMLFDAKIIYEDILKREPNHFDALHLLGVIAYQTRNLQQAERLIGKAIEVNPNDAAAFSNRGMALQDLKRLEEALASYDKAIALKPDYAEAYNNRGNALLNLNRLDEALASYDKAIALKPAYAEAYLNRGNAFQDLERLDEAFASYDKAIALKPDYATAYNNRGNALLDLKRLDEALASYDKAIALKPDYATAYNNRGNALLDLKRLDEALASYDKAIALQPDYATAYNNRGNAYHKLKRDKEAANAFAEALKIDSQLPFTKGMLLYEKMLSCDWKEVDALIAEIYEDVILRKLSAKPFCWQGVSKSQRSLQLCSELYNKHQFPAINKVATSKPFANHQKIRIGYSSGELREQATSHLIVGLLELHDDSRFEIYGIDNGWDDQSEIRQRINASVHSIIDIRRLSDRLAAAAICQNEIDILVNLNGYFGEQRTGVFANRCAPIQVNYLGFPGTLGADYMDYIIADQLVIPESHKEFYSEKVVYLPNCYQANDNKTKIAACNFSRLDLGLPEKGFVFCCFNNSYKILPDLFACWMRILKQVEGSVLWLLEDNASAASNLKKEAVARGVSSERLVFAKRMPLPEHLARHKLADLFLDTLPCNAHTTASDALWSGLPVLTCLGETFAGRVAASLLSAIGLPELITATLEAYEQMAVDLATHPERLAEIRGKLTENRDTTPLFDTELFAKDIETAYTIMYERHRAGLAPDHFVVPN